MPLENKDLVMCNVQNWLAHDLHICPCTSRRIILEMELRVDELLGLVVNKE